MTPLNEAKIGENIKISRILGDDSVRSYLAELGFVPDSSITVLNKMGGSLILQVKGSRIAVCEEMASRIEY